MCQDILVQTARQASIPKLYHYEAFKSEYLADILTNNRIHVSNIGNVNDPWDCRPWFEKDVCDPRRRREWAAFLMPMLEFRSEEQREAIAEMNPPWTDDEAFLTRTIDSLIASVVENNIKRWRMYCLTPHPDSILMWSHYSNKHTGICLEFGADTTIFGAAQKVTYCDSFQTIGPALLGDGTALTEMILLTKSNHWSSYETEYRLLPRDRKLDPTFSVTCEDEFLRLPAGALHAVIAGAKCSNTDLNAIETLVRNHAPHVVVKRAVCTPHKYDVSITP